MNKIFTQIALGVVCLFANVANAQVNTNFETPLPSCWLTSSAVVTSLKTGNSNNNVVSFTNNGTSTLGSPYINFSSGQFSIQFNYRLVKNNNGNNGADKSRTLQVGYQDVNGVFTALTTSTSVTSQSFLSFVAPNNNTFTIPNGTYQIVIKGEGNGSNEFVVIDDLIITGGSYHYSNPCNTAPVATDNTFPFQLGKQPYTGNFMTDGTADIELDKNESMTIVNVSQPDPLLGKITYTANGNFTFEPSNDFDGERITFTYQLRDNGYNPELSRIATVTLTFFQGAILPVHFTSFSGNVANNKAALTWNVADNETGSHFEIERSTDGKGFKTISTMFTSNQAGNATYTYADAGFVSSGSYYRIKVINKDNTTSYSKIISIKGSTAVDNKIVLMQNPVQSSLNFTFTSAADEANEVAIYNLAGVKMYSQKVQARKGTNSVSLSLDGKLIRGNYILTVQSASANRSIQFVKQ